MDDPIEEDIRDYIDRQLRQMLDEKMLEYTCPRCNIIAPPHESDPKGPGWCPLCGMDPKEEGPRKPPSILKSASYSDYAYDGYRFSFVGLTMDIVNRWYRCWKCGCPKIVRWVVGAQQQLSAGPCTCGGIFEITDLETR